MTGTVTTRIPIVVTSFQNTLKGSNQEIYFGLQKRVYGQAENITVTYATNSLFNSSAVYLILVKQKEKIVGSAFSNFTSTLSSKGVQAATPNAILINSNTLPSAGGSYQLMIYRILSPWYNYDMVTGINNNNTAQSLATVASWLELRATATLFRKPAPAQNNLTFMTQTDKSVYFPGDLVRFNVTVYNGASVVSGNSFINLAITDSSSYSGL